MVPLKVVAPLAALGFALLMGATLGYGELQYRRGHTAGADAEARARAAAETARAAEDRRAIEAEASRARLALAQLDATREAARAAERSLRARLAAVAVADPPAAACVLDPERLRIATDAIRAANGRAGGGDGEPLPAAGRADRAEPG